MSGLSPETAATLGDALAAAVEAAVSGGEPTLTWIGPIAPGTAAAATSPGPRPPR